MQVGKRKRLGEVWGSATVSYWYSVFVRDSDVLDFRGFVDGMIFQCNLTYLDTDTKISLLF